MTVEDTGVGIREDIKDKLFSPLFTNKAKGTGLGLAVCKRIVELHDGTITVESEEGRACTICREAAFLERSSHNRSRFRDATCVGRLGLAA